MLSIQAAGTLRTVKSGSSLWFDWHQINSTDVQLCVMRQKEQNLDLELTGLSSFALKKLRHRKPK